MARMSLGTAIFLCGLTAAATALVITGHGGAVLGAILVAFIIFTVLCT